MNVDLDLILIWFWETKLEFLLDIQTTTYKMFQIKDFLFFISTRAS